MIDKLKKELSELEAKHEALEKAIRDGNWELAEEELAVSGACEAKHKELNTLHLDHWLERVAPENRPEVIEVMVLTNRIIKDPKDSIVLFRSPKAPAEAFVVFSKRRGCDDISISLPMKDGEASRGFSLLCGSCPGEFGGQEKIGLLMRRLSEVCKEKGISVLYAQADGTGWRLGGIEGVRIKEAIFQSFCESSIAYIDASSSLIGRVEMVRKRYESYVFCVPGPDLA